MPIGLILCAGQIQADHKEHVVPIFVGQQKEIKYVSIGDLIVKGLVVQLQKVGVYSNGLTMTRSQTLQLLENASPGLQDFGLLSMYWVKTSTRSTSSTRMGNRKKCTSRERLWNQHSGGIPVSLHSCLWCPGTCC